MTGWIVSGVITAALMLVWAPFLLLLSPTMQRRLAAWEVKAATVAVERKSTHGEDSVPVWWFPG